MSEFNLRPEDQRLIDAAIGLGDWLAAYEQTTPAQVEAIRVLQAALRRLPEDSPEVRSAEYEFMVRVGDESAGLVRSWSLELYRRGAGEPGILEILNTYSAFPQDDFVQACIDDSAHESALYLIAGEPNHYTGDWHEWIEEVRDPRVWIVEGAQVEVDAEVRPPEWFERKGDRR